MRKTAHPSGGMDSSNPRRWRGERLHHHGDGVCLLFVLVCAVSSGRRHSSYVDKYESNLKVTVIDETKCPTQACTIPYLRLPMGYAGSADIFQAEMMNLMEALEYVRAYIDDLLVITRGSLEDYLE